MRVLLLALLVGALGGCALMPTPEPTPTLRAPECFDGAPPEKGCPSWAYEMPAEKTVSHHSVEGDVVYIHYTDGTKDAVWTMKQEATK